MGGNYFVALNSNGRLFLVEMSYRNGMVSLLNVPQNFKTIVTYRGGSNILYGITNNNQLYRIKINTTLTQPTINV